MKSREIRALSDEKLLDLYEDKKEQLYTQRQNIAMGELKDTSAVLQTRREIARIKTIMHERQLAAEIAKKDK